MLLYLDIDGVMVPAKSWSRPEILDDGFPAFSSIATRALRKIISNSNSDIILTTSHKHKYNLKEWNSIFKKRNISVKIISLLPENTLHLNRKEELLQWFNLRQSPENEFLIIDDDKSLNSLPPFLKDHLILTSGTVGLTEELANLAIEKIRSPKLS